MYGQTFQLSNPASHGMNAPSLGPGMAGEFTNQPGMLSYMEICKKGEFKLKILGNYFFIKFNYQTLNLVIFITIIISSSKRK